MTSLGDVGDEKITIYKNTTDTSMKKILPVSFGTPKFWICKIFDEKNLRFFFPLLRDARRDFVRIWRAPPPEVSFHPCGEIFAFKAIARGLSLAVRAA